ncbi:CoA transferase [Amycolatopsis sp. NPDC023774]|uniref:CoA transferase n=1 Tax=Amycolatopsis sp. NPDC023774 TaxID=3155015 RepID=UPI0033F945F8
MFAKVRSVKEFVAEPVFEHLASRPLIEIEKVADTPPEPLPDWGTHPLSGIRALGMGRVIAGAGIGRALAALGADVLNVWRVMEFEMDSLVATVNVGVRSTRLNVRAPTARRPSTLSCADADVFHANRRPGPAHRVRRRRPPGDRPAARPRPRHSGCHGDTDPWANRGGFDQVAETVTGMVAAEGTLGQPKLPPTSIINDYLVAWLGATGALAALIRRATDGGSYRVHVSLTRAAMWATILGFFDRDYVRRAVGSGGEHELLDPQLFTPLGLYQGVTETSRSRGPRTTT